MSKEPCLRGMISSYQMAPCGWASKNAPRINEAIGPAAARDRGRPFGDQKMHRGNQKQEKPPMKRILTQRRSREREQNRGKQQINTAAPPPAQRHRTATKKPKRTNAEASTPSGVTTHDGLLKILTICQKSRSRSAIERGGIGRKAKSHQSQRNCRLLRIRYETQKQTPKLATQAG